MLANNIHQKDAPFIKVICATIPAELFGYAEGAFTGAQKRREGWSF
ncbi:sigma 54-interacting transcriptional regulator [Peribacillus butanolivorans]